MSEAKPKIRLYIDAPLHEGAVLALDRGPSNYLVNVMRLSEGAAVEVFNGREGGWRVVLSNAHRKAAELTCKTLLREQTVLPDIHLLFAPIKKARTEFIVEKACELGCASVRPVITRYTNSERLNLDRLRAHMVEAAEQCGAVSVPDLIDPAPLETALRDWPERRLLIFCDESRDAAPLPEMLTDVPRGTGAAVLIGPEGGFSPEEAAYLRGLPQTRAVTLGPRILRADTAAVAALTLTQMALGDWGG